MSSSRPTKKQDILQSNTTRYQVLDFSGEGSFGKVAKCLDLNTLKTVAVKIHKDSEDQFIQNEVEMLEVLRALDPEKSNIVTFIDSFRFNDLSCLAFEMLDMSLWDLMNERDWEPLSLHEIRSVTHQLLVAFQALKSIGIMHTDLKPDNVMLVNHKDQPFKIKLIDFGLALPSSKVKVGMQMQAISYRAPEVTLGLPLSESVDMWGVGCVMAFLYFAMAIFPDNCLYHCMKTMIHLLGEPDHHLTAGKFSWLYFICDPYMGWRLRTPEEYKEVTGTEPDVYAMFFDSAWDLKDAIQSYPKVHIDLEYKDRMQFTDLLMRCLATDDKQRITPRDALQHTFITKVNLEGEMAAGYYTDAALQLTTVPPLEDSKPEFMDYEYCDYFNPFPSTDFHSQPSWYHGRDSELSKYENEESRSYSDNYWNSNSCSRPWEDDTAFESSGEEQLSRCPSFQELVKLCCLQRHQPGESNWDDSTNSSVAGTKTFPEPAASLTHDEAPALQCPTGEDHMEPNMPPGPSTATTHNRVIERTRKFFTRMKKRLLSIFNYKQT